MAQPAIDVTGAYQLAFEASPRGVVIVDHEGTIVLVNRQMERQYGYSRNDLIGRGIDVLGPELARDILAARAASLAALPMAGEPPATHPIAGRRKDGSQFDGEIESYPIESSSGRLVVASVVDITTRHHLDAAAGAVLEQRFALERLIAELSSRFINLPADQLDDAIQDGLRQACELLRLDCGTFVGIGPEGALLTPLSWRTSGLPATDASTTVRERFPWTIDRVLAGEVVRFATLDEIPHDVDRASYDAIGTHSAACVPFSVDGRVTAILGLSAGHSAPTWPELLQPLYLIASVFAQAVARRHKDEALQAAMQEAQRLKSQAHVEHVYLQQEGRQLGGTSEIVGQSAALREVLAQIDQVAPTDSTVLLLGETGTGKELLATHIHSLGTRRGRPMVRVNCAAIPATLIESELFGREKGAFTGALSRQVGRFELADHSTIFLDEIGDLPLDIQVKLLRVLEERRFERLGSPRSVSVDTRVIAGTHRNLEQRIAEGAFREDLYYRLNVFPIQVPALRERVEDIPRLVSRFIEEFSRSLGKRIDLIDRESLTALQEYSWPGNIRELRNVVERAMIVTTSRRLTIALPETSAAASARPSPKLIDVEKEHILAVLESAAWRIRGAGGAANRLGMKPTTLETRMAKLGLKRPGSLQS